MSTTRYQKIDAHNYRHIWAVGDIHGDYQLLQSRLHQLSFCPETDLLISTGDNIDRGAESLNVLRLLKATTKRWLLMHSRLAMAICGWPVAVTGFSI